MSGGQASQSKSDNKTSPMVTSNKKPAQIENTQGEIRLPTLNLSKNSIAAQQ